MKGAGRKGPDLLRRLTWMDVKAVGEVSSR